MPIVSVTPLGSAPDGVGSAIGQIIDYLERCSRRPPQNASLVGYYADTPNTAGVWRGRGVDGYQLTGPVHTETFRTVLEGNHPLTKETLVSAVGSSGRADPTRSPIAVSPTGEPGEVLSTEQVAALLGVSDRYVRKVAAEVGDPTETTKARLDGVRADGRNWIFRRDDIEGFAAGRSAKKVVVAYDVTVSFEKSISLAWARASTGERGTIEAALDAGTNAAVAYLEDHAVAVRRGRGVAKADGVWAASYRHLTNRNLEPQLHDHVVIANIGWSSRCDTTASATPAWSSSVAMKWRRSCKRKRRSPASFSARRNDFVARFGFHAVTPSSSLNTYPSFPEPAR